MYTLRRIGLRFVLATGLVLSVGSCSSEASENGPLSTTTMPAATPEATTIDTSVAASNFQTPEALRDALVEAIATGEADRARALWPSATWDVLGSEVMNGFVPGSDQQDCDRTSDSAAHCVVFEHDWPRALELTLSLDGSGSWTITGASLESTN